jgi:hypothetical protein
MSTTAITPGTTGTAGATGSDVVIVGAARTPQG